MKTPSDTVLQYIRDNLRYDPDTGVISRGDKQIGNLRKKDNHITVSLGYGKLGDGTQLTYMTYGHQVAWYLTHGAWPSGWLDHIDGDGANNRLNNLRLATAKENQYNRRKVGQLTSSRFKGVQYRKDVVAKPWRAYINHQGKRVDLGYHTTELEAAVAYDTKAKELFGVYARCNIGPNSAVSSEWQQLELPWS